MSKQKGKSVAQKTIERLQEFTETLESGEGLGKFTCRKVVLDLHPQPYSPDAVKDTRKILGASQTLFAQFLGVNLSTLQKWEQGRHEVPDMACRFMDEIRHNPEYWQTRFRESVSVTPRQTVQ